MKMYVTNEVFLNTISCCFQNVSCSYVGAKVWNEIPNYIRNVESTHLFKHKMKTYLLGQ